MNNSPADTESNYRGRFAPSPTGPLHSGSLVAALASFLDARHHNGKWQLRIDDIDPPRAVAGSIDAITEALVAHGLIWDGPILCQSQSSPQYNSALDQLIASGWLFRCLCTRATLDASGGCGQHCQEQNISAETPHSLRVKAEPDAVHRDRDLGVRFERCGENLASDRHNQSPSVPSVPFLTGKPSASRECYRLEWSLVY